MKKTLIEYWKSLDYEEKILTVICAPLISVLIVICVIVS